MAPARNLGRMVFGPGKRDACENVDLNLRPVSELRRAHHVGGGQAPALRPDAADERGGRRCRSIALPRERPAVIVLLTDGEETCRGNPCAVAQKLKRQGADVTVHVIGYMLRYACELGGGQSRCLSESTGGMFLSTETTEELSDALRKTLACPLISSRALTGRPAR